MKEGLLAFLKIMYQMGTDSQCTEPLARMSPPIDMITDTLSQV